MPQRYLLKYKFLFSKIDFREINYKVENRREFIFIFFIL